MTVSLRPATTADVGFLHELVSHPDVAAFLAAVRASSPEEIAAEVDRALAEPEARGVLVIEDGGVAVGTVAWETANRRSRIADVRGLAVHPGGRGRGVAREALAELVRHLLRDRGLHRLQAEVYGFNERALALLERAGFTREGTRRRAYRRHGEWVDGVLFGLVAEDVDPSALSPGSPPDGA